MRWLCIFVAACAADPGSKAYLPSDATFIRADVPQCLQDNPDHAAQGYPCCQILSFGTDGSADKTSGEEGFPGTYELDGPLARGQIFHQDFTFDFSTNLATGRLVAGQWLPDDMNLTAVACR
jgi:hypothetical protein